MRSIIQNIRYGARLLAKRPGFTAMAVLVLALGIGANTAMFSLVNAFLFKPLMIREPERIVGLYAKDTKRPDTYRAFSYPEYAEIRASNKVFSSLMAHNMAMVGLAEGESTRRVFADLISSNYFETLGAPLARGRTFTAEEERPGSAIPVAIVSWSFWEKNGADPSLLGKSLRVNGKVYTIVGIAAKGFTGTTALVSSDIYLPLGMYESAINDFEGRAKPLAARDNHALIVVGRLRAGLGQETADAQLAATWGQMDKPLPDDKDQALVVQPLSRLSVSTSPTDDKELRVPSLLMLFLSGIVLLIASLNVANMILARGNARKKEMAIRLALGAGRSRIVSQGFVEGLVLAFLGGVVGLVFAYWGTTLLVRSLASIAPIQLVFSAVPDPRVLAATLGFCLVSTMLFSLAPSWNLSRPNMTTQLKSDEKTGTEGGKDRRLLSRRNLLVIGQLSLSLMLLSIAGLFIRSSFEAARLDPGFRTDQGVIVEIDPSLAGYDKARGAQVTRELVERLRTVPGVESASMAATVPFGMVSMGRTLQRATDPASDAKDPAKKDRLVSTGFNIVGTDYFSTLGIALLRGRQFRESETSVGGSAPGVAVIDKLAAERLWPKGDALGQRIRMVEGEADLPAREVEVVGVVANVREHIIGSKPSPWIYVPFGQETQSNMNIHLKIAAQGPEAERRLLDAVRREIRAVDGRLPVLNFRTLRDHLEASFDIWIVRTAARMFTLFGVVALLLAAVGLYGVRAYTVSRRTREIGIRMAIGASAGDALRLILREGLLLTAIGSGVGLLLSLALGKVLAGMLYQVSFADPIVFSATPVLLALVSLLACYVPASRAARIQPMVALRSE
ncbi:MAG TPA: ABC transporter permease [Thermoanaerobaculia bacterium]|jgi:predicted permease|nr:ABC transporter permease [Thermoanaerobaculia bacterium]